MKHYMKRVALVAVAALVVVFAGTAEAQSVGVSPITNAYESGSVAAGAQIQSTAMRTGNARRFQVHVDNSLNGATTGTLTIAFLARDCATKIGQVAVTVAANATNGGFATVQVASDQPGVTTTGFTQVPIDPPPCIQATLAAAGAVARQMDVYVRQ